MDLKIDFPEEVYLVNQFSVNFLEDGTKSWWYYTSFGCGEVRKRSL